MVDNIEVKLDEIDAKIDKIAYAPTYKPTYEIDEMIKKRAGTAAGGIGVGGVTGGIILAEAINNLAKQSKILSTIQETVGRALGLLVDLVLLPFLPLIVWGMVMLYQVILWVGQMWQTWMQKGAIALDVDGKKPSEVLKGIFDWIMDFVKAWGKAFNDMELAAVKFVAGLLAEIVKFLMDLGKEIGTKMADQLWAGLKEWQKIFTSIWNTTSDMIASGIKGWGDAFNTAMEYAKTIITGIKDAFITMLNFIIEKINMILPAGMKIGTMQTSAEAFNAKYASARASEAANQMVNYINISGLTQEQLPSEIMNALRQVGAGYIK